VRPIPANPPTVVSSVVIVCVPIPITEARKRRFQILNAKRDVSWTLLKKRTLVLEKVDRNAIILIVVRRRDMIINTGVIHTLSLLFVGLKGYGETVNDRSVRINVCVIYI